MEKQATFNRKAGIGETVTSEQMKELERRADEAGLSYYQMMENAGTGAACRIALQLSIDGKTVIICCGKGNNGGDGFVVARKLTEMGATVKLILVEGEPKTEDAITNKQRCEAMAIPIFPITEEKEISRLMEEADLLIDAIYGTGFHGVLRDPVRKLARLINRSKAPVYALDIPSGLNGDTGEADADAVRANCTVAFHRFKPAHMNEACGVYNGQPVCISIGIEAVLKGGVQ